MTFGASCSHFLMLISLYYQNIIRLVTNLTILLISAWIDHISCDLLWSELRLQPKLGMCILSNTHNVHTVWGFQGKLPNIYMLIPYDHILWSNEELSFFLRDRSPCDGLIMSCCTNRQLSLSFHTLGYSSGCDTIDRIFWSRTSLLRFHFDRIFIV